MTARDIEVAVASHFNYRRNLIVPNVSWGLACLGHEADVLVLSAAGYASEIEIKVSKADLLRDSDKRHQHESGIVKAFWFAVPSRLGDWALAHIPESAGLLVVSERWRRGGPGAVYEAKRKRAPSLRPDSRRFTDAEREQLARLAAMRYWDRRADPVEAVLERIAI
jgi:hypothetical protein